MKIEFTAAQVAALLGGKVEGDPEVKVSNIARIEDGAPGMLSFLSNPKYWTVPLTVYGYFGKYNGSNWELVFASLVLIALPIVIVYLMGQKYIVSGLTSGAVKQ